MGQYYFIVNITKKQYLHPHKFDDGLKLMEFGQSAGGTLLGLTILLANGNGRGGGDVFSSGYHQAEKEFTNSKDKNYDNFPSADKLNDSIIGSWAGDKIVIAGDYGDEMKFIPQKDKQKLFDACLADQQDRDLDEKTKKEYANSNCNLFTYAEKFCEDISEKVIACLVDAGEWERKQNLRPDIVLSTK